VATMTGWFAAPIASLVLACSMLCAQQGSHSDQACGAPVYFGLCDPYVPGTIIRRAPDMKAIDVLNTWPDGPAEKAGVCPGDQITAVNGIPVPGHTWDEMLNQLVSPVPSPIELKIMRHGQELNFRFDRARETTLAQLSHERYVRGRQPMAGTQVFPVPAGEAPEEIGEVGRFYDSIDHRVGFKFVGGLDVPEGTPEDQVRALVATAFEGPEHSRWVGLTRMALGENGYSAGLDAILLKNPEEVLVNHVLPDSPAQRAGLFPGDRVLEIDGHQVSGLEPHQISDLILKPDEPRDVIFKLLRGSSTLTIKLHTQMIKEIYNSAPYYWVQSKSDVLVMGLVVVGVENPREAIVAQVEYPSPAFDAGLHVGDRVLSVNGIRIERLTRQQLTEILQPKTDSELKLDVTRLNERLAFQFKPETPADALAKIGRKITKSGSVPAHCPES
jgi:C-terminal processing protease CtpA/Prc